MNPTPLRLELLNLHLRQVFRIAKASAEKQQSLIVRWFDGLGEGAPSIHYGLSASQLLTSLEALIARSGEIRSQADIRKLIELLPPDHNVARCALEMALLDQEAKRENQPLWQYLGLRKPASVESSMTITPGNRDELKSQLERAEGFSSLKLKVGFNGDLRFVDQVLKLREARLRLDANGGWSVGQAIESLRALAGYPLDFVEEPLSDPTVRDLDKVKMRVECVLFLDESIKALADLHKFHEVADGVNLKLAKCGGLLRTLELAQEAREHNLRLLLGCMLESAVGITAALHLASLFDYFDLDAIVLTENDPYWGAQFENGHLLLPEGAGIGIAAEERRFA
ncbi:MAG: enolase C-terminal domain-like protein [bacterium]